MCITDLIFTGTNYLQRHNLWFQILTLQFRLFQAVVSGKILKNPLKSLGPTPQNVPNKYKRI